MSGGKNIAVISSDDDSGDNVAFSYQSSFGYTSRCAPSRVVRYLRQLEDSQTNILRDHSLLSFTSSQLKTIHRPLISLILQKYDYENHSFKLPSGNVHSLTPEDVHSVYGLPLGSEEVRIDSVSVEDCVRWAGDLGITEEYINSLEVSWSIIEGRINSVPMEDVDSWFRLLFLLLVGCIFVPKNHFSVDIRYLYFVSFNDAAFFTKFNWCKFVLDQIKSCMSLHHNGTKYITADLQFLSVLFLQKCVPTSPQGPFIAEYTDASVRQTKKSIQTMYFGADGGDKGKSVKQTKKNAVSIGQSSEIRSKTKHAVVKEFMQAKKAPERNQKRKSVEGQSSVHRQSKRLKTEEVSLDLESIQSVDEALRKKEAIFACHDECLQIVARCSSQLRAIDKHIEDLRHLEAVKLIEASDESNDNEREISHVHSPVHNVEDPVDSVAKPVVEEDIVVEDSVHSVAQAEIQQDTMVEDPVHIVAPVHSVAEPVVEEDKGLGNDNDEDCNDNSDDDDEDGDDSSDNDDEDGDDNSDDDDEDDDKDDNANVIATKKKDDKDKDDSSGQGGTSKGFSGQGGGTSKEVGGGSKGDGSKCDGSKDTVADKGGDGNDDVTGDQVDDDGCKTPPAVYHEGGQLLTSPVIDIQRLLTSPVIDMDLPSFAFKSPTNVSPPSIPEMVMDVVNFINSEYGSVTEAGEASTGREKISDESGNEGLHDAVDAIIGLGDETVSFGVQSIRDNVVFDSTPDVAKQAVSVGVQTIRDNVVFDSTPNVAKQASKRGTASLAIVRHVDNTDGETLGKNSFSLLKGNENCGSSGSDDSLDGVNVAASVLTGLRMSRTPIAAQPISTILAVKEDSPQHDDNMEILALIQYAWDTSLDEDEDLFQAIGCESVLKRKFALTLQYTSEIDVHVVDSYTFLLNRNAVIGGQVKKWIFPESLAQSVYGNILSTPMEEDAAAALLTERIDEWASTLDFSAVDLWFFPFFNSGDYVLFVMDIIQKKYHYIDLRNNSPFTYLIEFLGEKLVHFVISFIKVKKFTRNNKPVDFGNFTWHNQKKVKLHDQNACGIYVLNFCKEWEGKYKNGMSTIWRNPEVLKETRKKILAELMLSDVNVCKQRVLTNATARFNQ
ncbi:hypothetical protein LINPERHAP2_LOCUS25141 [Linum perenne]